VKNGKAEGDVVVKEGPAPSVPKRVALVGLGPTRAHYINEVDAVGNRYDKFDETWTMNSFCNVIESDRLWHMDNIAVQELRAQKNEKVCGMLKAMKNYKGPIYTSVHHDGYHNLIQFPLFEVIQKFGSAYFNSTPAYAIAYAMYIGVKELWLFGLDYTWPDVHKAEQGRACCEFWLGKATMLGMKIQICRHSTLMDSRYFKEDDIPLYGYDGYRLAMEESSPGKIALRFFEKPLPTAEEIEKRYDHILKADDIKKEAESGAGASRGHELPASVPAEGGTP